MDLKEFVQQTITEIVKGIASSQEEIEPFGGIVNPPVMGNGSTAAEQNFVRTAVGAASVFNFDIALTATEGKDTKAGISVVSGLANLGAGGNSNSENSSVSRIQFSVPVALPKSGKKGKES